MPSAYLHARLRSFAHAFRGLKLLLQSQQNARIHAFATVLALAAKAKDVAAGAVLIAAIASVIIGGLVFGPHILRLLTG